MTKAFQRELHGYVALHDPCSVDARWLPCFGYKPPEGLLYRFKPRGDRAATVHNK